jgi:hypothetical protein
MRVIKNLSILLLLFILISNGVSQSAGTTSFEFLRSQYSPRGAAMGGNLIAIKEDIHSLLYNPAAIAGNNDKQWSINYIDHLLDFQAGYLAFAQPYKNWGNISFGLIYFNYGTFNETDEFGDNTGRTFGASEFALNTGLSNSLGGGFDYGVGFKFIHSSLDNYNASCLAIDLGLMYNFHSIQDLKVGISLLNLGTTIDNYTNHKEKLPILLNIGISKRLEHLPLLFTANLNDITATEKEFIDRLKRFSLGGEFDVSKIIKFRFGYQNEINQSVKPLGRSMLNGFSLGLGIYWRQYRFDYAYSNFGNLGSQNRIGISGTL